MNAPPEQGIFSFEDPTGSRPNEFRNPRWKGREPAGHCPIVYPCLILCTWVASRCVDRDAATSAAPGPGAWVVYRAAVAVLVGCWQCGDGPRNMPGLQQAGSGMCLQGLATGWQDRVADQGHGGTARVRVQEENDWYCSIDGSCLIQL